MHVSNAKAELRFKMMYTCEYPGLKYIMSNAGSTALCSPVNVIKKIINVVIFSLIKSRARLVNLL